MEPGLLKRELSGRPIMPSRAIRRRIVLMSVLLLTAIVGSGTFSAYREYNHVEEIVSSEVDNKLRVAVSILESQPEKMAVIAESLRQQAQSYADYLDYDKIGAISVMLNTITRLYNLDFTLIYNEDREILASNHHQIGEDRRDLYKTLIEDTHEIPGLERIPLEIVEEQMPNRPFVKNGTHALAIKDIIHIKHNTGGIYGYVVLVKLINGNLDLLNRITQVTNADVVFYDQEWAPISTSFPDVSVPAPEKGLIRFQGAAYIARTRDLKTSRGVKVGSVAVAIDTKPFSDYQRLMVLNNLIPFLISVLICFILFWTLRRRVFEKINLLVLALRRVGKDEADLRTRVKVSTNHPESRRLDEIDIMCMDFNRMMDRLEETHRQLVERRNEAETTRENLEKINKSLQTLLTAIPFGIIYMGLDKKVRMANRVALSMMGYESEAQIVGKTCHQNLCPAQFGQCPVLDLGKKVDSSDRILIHRDGHHIPILKTVRMITLGGEEILLEVFSDIRELKKAQADAEAASKAKSEFLANMSHELRTPLNHIIGFTEMMVDKKVGDLNPAQEEYLLDVLGSSRHLLSLINGILDLSKVEAGKMELNPSQVDIRKLLENSLIMVKEKALRHGIGFNVDCDGVPDLISADEQKLKQVMYNLLSNAVKFTPDGGAVHINAQIQNMSHGVIGEDGTRILPEETGESLPRKEIILISVSDTGIGIRKEDLEKIFQPFEQSDGSASRRYEGTGLGLTLSRKFVELHGGKIWAESEGEGKGSKFIFYVPRDNRNSNDAPDGKNGLGSHACRQKPQGCEGGGVSRVSE